MNKIHSGALKNYLLSQNTEEKTITTPPLYHLGGEFSLHTEAELILGKRLSSKGNLEEIIMLSEIIEPSCPLKFSSLPICLRA